MGIEVDRAEGVYIYDTAGKKYMDMIAGLAVSNLGHGHPKILQAIKEQADKHLHVMVYGEFYQKAQMQLSKRLTSLLPDSLNCCYFLNSGAEANEAALKLAKRVTGRRKIISFHGAYHGSTHGALSVSGNQSKKDPFEPLLPEVEFIQLNHLEDLDKIDQNTAAVILETIQADAGIRIPDIEFLHALRKRCSEVGAMLILDEIQAGMGRTGKWWAFEHFDIEPDILTLGKALGAGMPIGAMISSKERMQQLSVDPILGHITTFGGHPLVCAAADAGLQVMQEEKLIDKVGEKADLLNQLISAQPLVQEIRYKGLFFAIEMKDADIVQQVVEGCLEKGVISFWFLSCPQAFRLAPPLTISHEEIEKAANIILSVMDKVGSKI